MTNFKEGLEEALRKHPLPQTFKESGGFFVVVSQGSVLTPLPSLYRLKGVEPYSVILKYAMLKAVEASIEHHTVYLIHTFPGGKCHLLKFSITNHEKGIAT